MSIFTAFTLSSGDPGRRLVCSAGTRNSHKVLEAINKFQKFASLLRGMILPVSDTSVLQLNKSLLG